MKTIEIYADTRGPGRCRDERCGQPIIWATVVRSGKKMCFDGEAIALRTRLEPSTRRLIEEVDLDDNHWSRCPGAAQFKRRV